MLWSVSDVCHGQGGFGSPLSHQCDYTRAPGFSGLCLWKSCMSSCMLRHSWAYIRSHTGDPAPFQNRIKIVFYPRGQVQWLVPSLLIHAHSVFPSPHVKLDAWSQESPVWTKARLPGKGPFLHITSICKLRRQKKRCLTHEGDRRNNWLMGREPLKMKGLYVTLITTFISPGSSAFSAATGRSSVRPKCKSSSIIPDCPSAWHPSHESWILDSAEPTHSGHSNFPLLIPEGKSRLTTWAGKIR